MGKSFVILKKLWEVSMVQVSSVDLEDIKMDLEGMINLLTVMASSEYYKNSGEAGICRILSNSIKHTNEKLTRILESQ